MRDETQTRTDIARIARLTLPTCELEFRAFELYELQGYVELADHGATVLEPDRVPSVEVPMGLGSLSEPAVNLQFRVEAS